MASGRRRGDTQGLRPITVTRKLCIDQTWVYCIVTLYFDLYGLEFLNKMLQNVHRDSSDTNCHSICLQYVRSPCRGGVIMVKQYARVKCRWKNGKLESKVQKMTLCAVVLKVKGNCTYNTTIRWNYIHLPQNGLVPRPAQLSVALYEKAVEGLG